MKQKHNLFSKTIALAMAILIASTTLTGCSWFSSRQDESSQEVVLEAPEPDAQDPGEDIVDDSEVTADEDPTIQSDEEENVVEEPDTTTTGSKPDTTTTETTGTASGSTTTTQTVVVTTPQQTAAPTNTNKTNSSSSSSNTSKTSSTTKPTGTTSRQQSSQNTTAVYQPVGSKPVEKSAAKQLAQPTGGAPTPKKNTSYPSARFSQKGTYSESKVYQDGYIDTGSVTIANKTFVGSLYIKVPSGTVTLKNVDIQGTLYVHSGSDWVKLYDVNASKLEVESKDTSRVFASRDTELSNVSIKSETILEEGGMFSGSRGFTNVTVNAPKGTTLTMRNLALNLLTTRSDCDVVYDDDTIINYVYTYAPTDLYGYGQINRLYCYSDGVYYDAKPLYIETGRGYATPSKRIYSGGSGSSDQTKKVTLYDIANQYLDIGEKKIVGIDHNGSSLRVTTSNASVAKVTYSTAKSHITMTGVKPGRATIKVTSSRTGYESSTISFDIIVRDDTTQTVQLSGISNKYMDEGDVRYVNVNTNASRITLTNSNSRVAEVTADGFQLKIRARNAGTTTVKVTASRSGQISKSTTFKVIVSGNSSGSEDKVIIRKISDQIMNRGSERIINVNTDGSSIKATSSNSSVARVSTRRDDTLIIEAVGTGTARITVTASRRGYRDATTSFYVDVNGKTISAPTVYMNYPNGASYTNGSWSNQNITFNLTGYSSGRTAYSYERPAGGSSSQWGNRRELVNGTLTISAEGQKDYYFFTRGSAGDSEATRVYTVRIDKTKPVIDSASVQNNTLSFRVSDALSGVANVVVLDSNNTRYTPVYANGTYTFTPAAAGNYRAVVTDYAGNSVTSNTYSMPGTTQPDTTPPVITIDSTTTAPQTWQRASFDVKFSVSDSGKLKSVTADRGRLTQQTDGSYILSLDEEGQNTYTITAEDESGNKQTAQITYYLDETNPEINYNVNKESKLVTVTVADRLSGINSVKVTESGADVQLQNPSTNIYTFTGEAGKTYMVTAMDGAGNTTQKDVQIPQDTTTTPQPPAQGTITLSKISVSDPDGIAQSKTISFQIEQNLQPGETLNVTVQKQGGTKLDAAATQSGNSTNYSVEVSEDGTYEVTATISKDNVVLDTKKESVSVTGIDNEKPVIDSIEQTEEKDGSKISFKVTDANAVNVLFNGTTIAANADGSYSVTGIPAGDYTITATDAAGNTATQQVTVTEKQQAPTVTVPSSTVSSADGQTATTTITVDPHGSSVSAVEPKESGAQVTRTAENQYQFTATANGSYTVEVTTADNLSASVALQVTGIQEKTNEPPVIQLGEQQLNAAMTEVTIPVTVSDPDGSAADVKLTASGGSLTGEGGSYTFTATANGSYTFTAVDKDGNQATANAYVEKIIGNIAPAIRAGQPQVSAGTATAAITADPNGGAAITSVTGSEGCTVAPQGDGSYLLTTSANGTYTVTATNALGKTAQTTLTVSGIDSTPPAIGEPVVSYSEDRKTATVSLSVTDEGGVASVTFAGIEMSASGGSYQASVSQNGSYTVVAVDQAGNQQSATVQVSGIDLTPPSIQVTSANNSWQKSQTVTFSVTDENSGVSAVQVTRDGAPVAYTESSGYQFIASANGTYVIAATDKAGNQSTQSVTITMVDATAPAAPLLTNGGKPVNAYNGKADSVYKTDATSFAVSYQKAAERESPVTVKAKVDSGEYTALSADAPKVTLTAGTHTVKIKTVDAAGNESAEVTYQISVQTKQASEQTGTEKPETSDKQQEETQEQPKEKQSAESFADPLPQE